MAATNSEQVSLFKPLVICLIGYSGEDQPRSVIPSCAGVIDGQSALDDQQDVVMEESKNARFISGYNDIGFKRENMRIQPLYQEEGTRK